MERGWSLPIPQAMQQHGGTPKNKPAPRDDEPKQAPADAAAPALGGPGPATD